MSAIFSEDRKYRYELRREWVPEGAERKVFLAIGINPSTAAEVDDDPTVERLVGHTMDNGCNVLLLVNLYAYVATKPTDMRAVLKRNRFDAIGPDNNDHLRAALADPDIVHVVAMWGNIGREEQRRWIDVQAMVFEAGHDFKCFGMTKTRHPRHPARMAKHLTLEPWPPGRRQEIPEAPIDIPVARQLRKLPPLWVQRRRSVEAVASLRADRANFTPREGQPICDQCEKALDSKRWTHCYYPTQDKPGFWAICKVCGQPSQGYRWGGLKDLATREDFSNRPPKRRSSSSSDGEPAS